MSCMWFKKTNKMIAKIHKTHEGKFVLAVCDSDIIGKCYEEGEKQLDLSCDFYKGKEKTEEEVILLMKKVNIVNLCGNKSVQIGVKAGLIDKDNIIKISGIPHAEGVILREG